MSRLIPYAHGPKSNIIRPYLGPSPSSSSRVYTQRERERERERATAHESREMGGAKREKKKRDVDLHFSAFLSPDTGIYASFPGQTGAARCALLL